MSQQLSYHGRVIDSVTNLGVSGSVEFKVQVKTPSTAAANCLMYEEIIPRTLVNGVFVIGINNGTGVRTDTTGYTVQQIFSNKNIPVSSFTLAPCSAGGPIYIPLARYRRAVE